MEQFKVLFFIAICHYPAVLPSCISYPWQDCDQSYKEDENGLTKTCPEDHSLLSAADIVEMIDFVEKKLKVKESVEAIYNTKFENIRNKYLLELEDFHQLLLDRPKHIEHILEDMENKRHQIKSVVNLVTAKLQDIDNSSETFDVAAERANKLLTRFEIYKNICQLNCNDQQLEEKFDDNEYKTTLVNNLSYSACWKIKELYETVTDQLNKFTENFTGELSSMLENVDKLLRQHMLYYKDAFKKAAIEHFATTMYDILSLQDEYHHFYEYINNVNESLHSEKLNENISKILQELEALEGDVDKFGLQCMDCRKNSRRDTPTVNLRAAKDYSEEDMNTKIVDDLISKKIKAIRGTIINNFNDMFEGVTEYITDLDLDTAAEHIDKLLPTEEVTHYIEKEREAFDALKSAVSLSSLNKMKDLLQESEEILADLDNVQKYLDSLNDS